MITSIKYATPENAMLLVTYDNGKTGSTPWPCNTYHREAINAWISEGNVIEDADPIDELPLVKGERDRLLRPAIDLADRHRNETDLPGKTPTLDPSEFLELLQYMEDLRQVPVPGATMANVTWPTLPSFM